MLEIALYLLVGLAFGALTAGILSRVITKPGASAQSAEELRARLNETEGSLRVANDRLERMEESKMLQQQEFAQQKEELKTRVEAYQELSRNYAAVGMKAESLQGQLTKVSEESEAYKQEIKKLQTELSTSKERAVELDKENKYLKEMLDKQKGEVEEIGKKFSNEFKLLADSILEDKSKRFTEMNQNNIEQLLKPLGENIQLFQKKVEEVYDRESKERFSLGKEVERLVVLNQKISEEANNLTNALKGQVKQQGNWGEMILESILEKSGLVKDREYFVQESFTNDEGRRFQPDVIINYPDNRKLVIDSKVSLVAYERYSSSTSPEEQQKELASHVRSIRNHIDILSSKNYADLVGGLDFVTMFLPIEPAFILAMQADPEIWNYAYSKDVLLLSPTNLITALRLIHNLWQREYQNRHAFEIAERGGQLYDKFVGFVESLTAVGDNLGRSQKSYEQAMNQLSEGKGNLISRAQKLKELGAKAKKNLPSSMLENDDDDTDQPSIGGTL